MSTCSISTLEASFRANYYSRAITDNNRFAENE